MLHAPLKINGHPLFLDVQIVRQEQFRGPDVEYPYIARLRRRIEIGVGPNDIIPDIPMSPDVPFTHLYSDGAVVCLAKGLQALTEAGVTGLDRVSE